MGAMSDVRHGIKTNLETRLFDYNVFSYEHKSPPAWSIVVGWPDSYDPRATLEGSIDMVIPVRVVIPWQDDESSDSALEDAMDVVVAAIEADRTLNGKVSDLSCAMFTDIGARTMPNDSVVATFTIPVEVLV